MKISFSKAKYSRWLASAIPASIFLISGCSKEAALTEEEFAKAETVFNDSCLICHSSQEMQRGPIVDGLPAWYSQAQLKKFRDGIRGQNPENRSELLMGSTRDLFDDDESIRLLSQYISQLTPKPHIKVVRGNAERGHLIYGTCLLCHGAYGQGNERLRSPPLNMLEDWYLLDQLRKFASGKRGYHPEDPYGIQMAYSLKGFSDQDLKDVVAYIQGFSKPPESE
jgi:cytochrome c553